MIQQLKELILANDTSVVPVEKPLMGKPATHYEQRGVFKYAVVAGKNQTSLHCMPIYMDKELHAKYTDLFVTAEVQKGCINFAAGKDLPAEVIGGLIKECAAIDIAQVLENRKKKK